MSEHVTTIGENIKRFRIQKGITQKELAKRIQKSYSSVQKYEMDIATPPLPVMEKIAKALGVDKFEIIGWNNFESVCIEEIKNTPASEDAEVKEVVSLDETNALLVDMGYIREGEQLSLADLAFLEHIGGLMDAWFSSKRA